MSSAEFTPRAVGRSVWLAYGLLLGLALASWFGGALTYLKAYYALMAIAFACAAGLLLFRDAVPRDLLKWGAAVFGLYATFGLTALWALDPAHTLLLTAQDLIYPIIWLNAFLLARFTDARIASLIFRGMPLAVAILYAYLLARYGLIRPADVTTAREVGALGNAGAVTLLACLPYATVRAVRGFPGGIVEVVVVLVLLLVSQSRAGYLLGAVLLCVTVVRLRPLGARGAARVATGAGLAALAVTIFIAVGGATGGIDATLKRFTAFDSLVQSSAGDSDRSEEVERITMYVEGFNAWQEHPWLGIGYENLEGYIMARHGFPVASHNLLITLFAECGWPSVVVFCGFIYGFFRYTKRVALQAISDDARDFLVACRIAAAGFLAISMVHPLFHQQMFFVVLGLALGLRTPLNALPDGVQSVKRLARRAVREQAAAAKVAVATGVCTENACVPSPLWDADR